MGDDSEDGIEDFGLIMPFVACRSAGGEYDDNSFTAGWLACSVDDHLATLPEGHMAYAFSIQPEMKDQMDLIAMRHGFTLKIMSDEYLPDWLGVTFERCAPLP